MATYDYNEEKYYLSEDDLSTSSADSSDEDIDVENGEMDKNWVLGQYKKNPVQQKVVVKAEKNKKARHKASKRMRREELSSSFEDINCSYDQNDKTHHNASEKLRREQLKSCFVALKNSINCPEFSNNDALKMVVNKIKLYEDKMQVLDERLEEVERENLQILKESEREYGQNNFK